MSYERELLSNTAASALPSNPPPVMREERVFDPYKTTSIPKVPGAIGQGDKGGAKEETATGTEEAVKLSPPMAALARREHKFRQQQQQLEKDRLALASEKEEIAQLRAMKEKLAAKDYSGLDGLVDYNEYSQYQVNKINSSDPMQDELKKLTSKITDIEKNVQDNVTKQFEAAVSERRIAVQELVDKTNQFPRIKKAKANEAVVQHILDTWEHDSEELSIEQAAKEVEEVLVEKAKQWAALLEEEKEAAEEVEGKPPLPPLKQGLKTLTNQVTTSDVKRPMKSLQHMSDSERWAEARRRAEEKLQQQRR